MTITDEMVEKARMAYVEAEPFMSGSWKSGCLRAALEAVAPMLIAQGIREAAEAIYNMDADAAETILARAQELDPEIKLEADKRNSKSDQNMKPGWTLEFLAGYVAGMRAAAAMLPGSEELAYFDGKEIINQPANPDVARILARAQELDPR